MLRATVALYGKLFGPTATATMSNVPVGSGQKRKLPFASAVVSIMMRSTPGLSGCSIATSTLPVIGVLVTASITWPLTPELFALTCPAVSAGFKRKVPLPSRMIDAHALKSMLRSTDCPAPTVIGPPTICPGGIFKPVFASLLSSSSCTELSLNTTQLKPLLAQAFEDGTAAPVAGEFERRMSRICWYVPTGRLADPSCARMQFVCGEENRSICIGCVASCGASSCQPGVLSSAVALICV